MEMQPALDCPRAVPVHEIEGGWRVSEWVVGRADGYVDRGKSSVRAYTPRGGTQQEGWCAWIVQDF